MTETWFPTKHDWNSVPIWGSSLQSPDPGLAHIGFDVKGKACDSQECGYFSDVFETVWSLAILGKIFWPRDSEQPSLLPPHETDFYKAISFFSSLHIGLWFAVCTRAPPHHFLIINEQIYKIQARGSTNIFVVFFHLSKSKNIPSTSCELASVLILTLEGFLVYRKREIGEIQDT